MTREQKALIAVLGVAAIACLADRLFVLEPAPAAAESAAVTPQAVRPAAKPAGAAGVAKVPAIPEISIGERLQAAAAATQPIKSDPFSMEDKWMAPKAVAAAVAQVDQAEVFKKSHSLGGVMVSRKSASRALVNGQLVEVGKVVDGFKLTSVTHTSATFQSGDSKIVLWVPGFEGRD